MLLSLIILLLSKMNVCFLQCVYLTISFNDTYLMTKIKKKVPHDMCVYLCVVVNSVHRHWYGTRVDFIEQREKRMEKIKWSINEMIKWNVTWRFYCLFTCTAHGRRNKLTKENARKRKESQWWWLQIDLKGGVNYHQVLVCDFFINQIQMNNTIFNIIESKHTHTHTCTREMRWNFP
jgi:hypothetical protein